MKKIWQNILPVVSFVLAPLSGIFLIYATAAGILRGDWVLFLIALAVFTVCFGGVFVFGILSEG